MKPFEIEVALLALELPHEPAIRPRQDESLDELMKVLATKRAANGHVIALATELAKSHRGHVTTGACVPCFLAAGGELPPNRNFRVIDTDNFCGDYPDEQFVGPFMSKAAAEKIAEILNADESDPNAPRCYRAVPPGYKLVPGFEP